MSVTVGNVLTENAQVTDEEEEKNLFCQINKKNDMKYKHSSTYLALRSSGL